MEGGKGSSSVGRTPSAYVLEREHADVNRRRMHPLEGAPNFGISAVIATSES
jgi:hypothetical protein